MALHGGAAKTTIIEGGGGGGSATPNGLVTGGQVFWESGLTFRVSAATYYIGGVLYSSAEDTVTLTAADATNDRIDVIVLDDTGAVDSVDGTAAASPSEPDIDPSTQLKLTFVLVQATETSPAGVTNENIYLEDTEWTSSTSGSGFDAASTADPYAGAKSIEGTSVANGAYVRLTKSAALSLETYDILAMFVKSKASWNSKRTLRIQFLDSNNAAVGVALTLATGYWGFNSSNTDGYQLVAIPVPNFAVPPGTTVQALQIADAGGSIGFYIDNIVLQGRGVSLPPAGGESGITQEEADARYVRQNDQTGAPYRFEVACSDESTAIDATGTKITFRQVGAVDLDEIRASLGGACATGTFTVDVNVGGSTILSTKLTIDATEKTSTTAAAAAVLSSTSIADDAEITIDVDNVGDSAATGLKVAFLGYYQ